MIRWAGCLAGKETFEILIDGLCAEKRYIKAADILEALLWLEEMIADGVMPDSDLWNSLISLVCGNDVGSSSPLLEVFEDLNGTLL
jgi:hypothetical protein